MKKGRIIIVALFVTGLFALNAQSLKLAHINTQEFMASLPESDSAQAKIKRTYDELSETIEEMQVEFNKKRADYEQNAATYTDIKKQAKMAELEDWDMRIQSTSQAAQQQLQTMQQQLLTPIIEKVTKAIEEVARENGYTYVLDTSEGSMVIFAADNAIDITEKVKVKLTTAK